MVRTPEGWNGCSWSPRAVVRARAWMAVAFMIAIVVLMVVLAGCTWLGEVTQSDQARKIRAFWCGERIPQFAAVVQAFAPDSVDFGVKIAVAAAVAMCKDERAPVDVLVAKGVIAGKAVAAVGGK